MRFCGSCGGPLSGHCDRCGFENPPEHKFCGQCASPLHDAGRSSGSEHASGVPPARTSVIKSLSTEAARGAAERRQLTVVFCDIVESVQLSQAVDAEELREILRAYQDVVGEAVERHDGHVAQFLGDGILVYFGYPAAHEDDAARAIRAALESIDAVKRLNEERRVSVPIAIRVGIHTGMGVVGEVGGAGKHENLAIGNTPNIAARLQGIARPNQVVISGETLAIVDGLFEIEGLREATLKGVGAPMQVATVVSASGLRGRIAVQARAGLRPLVGRERDLKVLQERLESARHGRGQTVLVAGDAGMGKSRLLNDFLTGQSPDVLQLATHCSPYSTNSALLPLVELYRQLLGLDQGGSEASVLTQRLQRDGITDPHAAWLLASFLSVDGFGAELEPELSPVKRRERTLQLLSQLLLAQAALQPVIATFEDLHWIDPSTLEFIESVMEVGASRSLLILLTARPAFTAPWGFRPYLTQIVLERLSLEEAARIVNAVADGKALPPEIQREILAKTDGVPLYVEETTKAVIDSGMVRKVGDRYALNVPATLRDSLTARLDRLGDSREIAQLAAVIGREFSYDLLATVSPSGGRFLRRHLDQLMRAELIERNASAKQESYIFRHALIRDVAYDSLLRRTRQEFHGDIAVALQTTFADKARERPEFLAPHLEGAGRTAEAAAAWQRAAQSAQGRAAIHEAIAHYNHALELVSTLPENVARNQQELEIQGALGALYTATRGWSAPEVQAAYSQARALCEKMGDAEPLFPVLWGLWSYHLVSGQYHEALELTGRLHKMSGETGDPKRIISAHHALGYQAVFSQCDYQRGLEVARAGIELFDLQREREMVAAQQMSSTCALYDIGAEALWTLGYPAQAREMGRRAIATAKQLDHKPTLTFATASTVWGIAQLLRDLDWICEAADETLALSREEDFSFWPPLVSMFRAWAETERGDLGKVPKIRESLDIYRAAGAGVLSTTGYALVMHGLLAAERYDECLEVAAEAHSWVERSKEHHFESEILRLEGELLAALSRRRSSDEDRESAFARLDRARDFARARGARSLELRAAISRVRVCGPDDARRGDAVAQLREVYDWFTEGFDTADLKTAQRLLAT